MSTPYDAEWLEYDDDVRPVPARCNACGAPATHSEPDLCDYHRAQLDEVDA